MSRYITVLAWIALLISIFGCSNKEYDFPKYGRYDIRPSGDTIFHSIPDFALLNQDSVLITNEHLEGKIYISDFFFTFCPSICPIVMEQMMLIHEAFMNDDRVVLVSYALAPQYDDVSTLKLYANNLDVDQSRWHFLTGNQDSIFALAQSYLVSAMLDPEAPGGIEHSGKIIMVDHDRHIRAFCDGTEPTEVVEFIEKIQAFLALEQ